MKYYTVITVYGKNQKFVDNRYVLENALEQYKQEQINDIRNIKKWEKEINFIIYTRDDNLIDENGNGIILAYTIDGLQQVQVM